MKHYFTACGGLNENGPLRHRGNGPIGSCRLEYVWAFGGSMSLRVGELRMGFEVSEAQARPNVYLQASSQDVEL